MSNQSFADLGVSRAVVTPSPSDGITEPFAIQRVVIGDVLAGRDVLAKSPTGSGKTLAFGVPIVDRIAADARRPAALVLAPTRELATQIVDDIRAIARARALRVTAVYGGVGLVKPGQGTPRPRTDLVATPGRLEDLLARRAFDLRTIQILVLDEADRMLDMGFRPAVDRIVAACPARRARRCSSPRRSTARPGRSPGATRATRSCTSTARRPGAPASTSSTGSSRSRTSTASKRWSPNCGATAS